MSRVNPDTSQGHNRFINTGTTYYIGIWNSTDELLQIIKQDGGVTRTIHDTFAFTTAIEFLQELASSQIPLYKIRDCNRELIEELLDGLGSLPPHEFLRQILRDNLPPDPDEKVRLIHGGEWENFRGGVLDRVNIPTKEDISALGS